MRTRPSSLLAGSLSYGWTTACFPFTPRQLEEDETEGIGHSLEKRGLRVPRDGQLLPLWEAEWPCGSVPLVVLEAVGSHLVSFDLSFSTRTRREFVSRPVGLLVIC